jgi:hypothetical protein
MMRTYLNYNMKNYRVIYKWNHFLNWKDLVLDGRAGGHTTRRSSCDPSGHKSCRSSPSSGDQGQGLEADQGAVIKAVWLEFFFPILAFLIKF